MNLGFVFSIWELALDWKVERGFSLRVQSPNHRLFTNRVWC